MMIRPTKVISLLFLFIAGNTAVANDATIEIVSYGIYAHSPDNGKSWINPLSDKTIKGTSASPVHLNSTRSIPAQFPLFFGFEYTITNLKEKTIELTTEVSHPEIKRANGAYSTHYSDTNKFLIIDEKVVAINGYLLENKDEIAEGEWTFTVKLKDRTIITQSFIVTNK